MRVGKTGVAGMALSATLGGVKSAKMLNRCGWDLYIAHSIGGAHFKLYSPSTSTGFLQIVGPAFSAAGGEHTATHR